MTVDTSATGGFKVEDRGAEGAGVKVTAYQGTTNSNVRQLDVDAYQLTVSTGPVTGTTVTDRLLIADNGDISFYEDTGTTPKLVWKSADERLGIGTSSPEKPLHVNSGTGNIGVRVESSDATASIEFMDSGTTSTATSARVGGISNDFFVQTNGLERLRIDSLGGITAASQAGGHVVFNSNTVDADFRVAYNNGTHALYVDGATGNVGIGASSPSQLLELSGATAPTIRLNDTTYSQYAEISTANAGSLILKADVGNGGTGSTYIGFEVDGANEAMRIDASGNVSIGTSNSLGVLTIKAPASDDEDIITITEDGINQAFSINGNFAGSGSTGNAITLDSYWADDIISFRGDGNVGIGTSSPTSELHLHVSGASNGAQITFDSDYGIGYVGQENNTSNNLIIGSSTAGITFYASNSEAMRLDSSGNLLVGKTSPDNTSQGVTIYGTTAPGAASFVRSSGNTLVLNRLTTDGEIVALRKDGTTVGSIKSISGTDLSVESGGGVLYLGGNSGDAIRAINGLGSGQPRLDVTDDATTDLGASSSRFKDLYLSGTANVGVLSANAGTGQISATFESTDAGSYINIIDNSSGTFGAMIGAIGDDMVFSPNNVEAMRIDSSGLVGIGTDSPNYPLTIGDGTDALETVNIIATDAGQSRLFFSDASSNGQGRFTYDHSDNSLQIYTADTESMRIDSSGNVGIGLDGGYKLDVLNTTGNVVSARFTSTATSSTEYGPIIVLTNDPNDTTRYLLAGGSPTANRFVIFSNGNIQNQNNSYTGISDEKLKENIVDADSQWDDIKALRVRKYSFKEENASEPTQIGVIAQEVEAAGMSGLVYETADQDTAEDGSFVDTGEVTKTMKYSILYMKAVKALQEAMARIETLEAKVAQLES